METILEQRISGINFLFIVLGLVALFYTIRFADRMLSRAAFLGGLQAPLKRIVHYLQLIYEPVALILLSGAFVLLNPVYCGLIFILLLLIGFPQLRNYLSGILVQFNDNLVLGKRLQFREITGIISGIARLGLFLQTQTGRRFVNYSHLLSEGYTLISTREIGGFYQLKIETAAEEGKVSTPVSLMDILTTTPYLDWSYKPEFHSEGENAKQFQVKVLVREEPHLYELMGLIRERGYTCDLVHS